MNKNIFFGFFFLIISSIFTILFVPQFEFPDGTHHLVKIILVEENRISLDNIFSILRNLYFIIIQPFHEISLSFGINDICETMRNEKIMHCNDGTMYNDEFAYNRNSFSIFGIDINIYKYFNLSLAQHQITLILFNFFIYLICIISFSKTLIEKNFPLIIIIYLIFPSTLSYSSYISPNFLCIILNIVFFYLVVIRKFYLYLFLSILFTLVDYQNISHILISFCLVSYNLISKYLKLNILYLIFILLSSLLIVILLKDNIHDIIISYTSVGKSDLIYLDEKISLFNLIKSYLSFGLSLYYIGGSMQYLAHLFEYLIFLTAVLYFAFNKLLNIKLNKLDLENDKHLILSFFILSLFSLFILSLLFPTISQGRYYLFILLPVIYFYINDFKLLNILSYQKIILIFFTLNFIHSLKIYISF